MSQALGKATSWGKHRFKSKPAYRDRRNCLLQGGIVSLPTRYFSARWITQTHSTSVG